LATLAPGWLAAILVAASAFGFHVLYPPMSAAIAAILLGTVLRNAVPLPGTLGVGCKSLIKFTIPATIVLTGATLNFAEVAKGLPYLAVVVLAVVVGCLSAVAAGRLISRPKTSILIGAGTAICGTSAVVAAAPVVAAEDDDVLLAVSTINIFGLLVMLVLPPVGAWLRLSPEAFGVWAGSTVHAVPQAVTTGFAYGALAGAIATLVKLVRVTLLAPFLVILALWQARGRGGVRLSTLLPNFLWGFAGLALLNTLGWLPFPKALATGGNLLLTLSMAAMGLEVNLRYLIRTGGPALITGALASLMQCLATVAAIRWLL
jgi:uncharacterized integral membrane protein (TIGR00698 family)